VNASLKQLTHGELGKSHAVSFSGLNLGEAVFTPDQVGGNRRTGQDFSPPSPSLTCEVGAV
jgi:hypothetical protein